jgi:aspartokinase
MAVWSGERNPVAAISLWEKRQEEITQEKALAESAQEAHDTRMTLETAASKADAVRVALAELGETLTASAVAEWLSQRNWHVTPAYVRNIRSAQARITAAQPRTAIAAVPDEISREE